MTKSRLELIKEIYRKASNEIDRMKTTRRWRSSLYYPTSDLRPNTQRRSSSR
jgi:hypothetical protein